MRTEEEIREELKLAEERATEKYKNGDWGDMFRWNSYSDALEWVLEEED